MPLPPQKYREAVFQILFMTDFGPLDEEAIPFMMGELKTTRREMSGASERAQEVEKRQGEIDALITEQSTEYSLERISKVERTILRLALYELLFDPSIPPKVAIAEAIRLCRKFGTVESAQFVNAILDGVYKSRAAPAAEEPLPV